MSRVSLEPSLLAIYGKRVIIIGGGAQVGQVAVGAISEADRHNIRGERISPRDGRFIERVGFYDPCAPDGRESLRIAMDRVTYWQGKGAKLSDTAARLVKQFGTAQAA